MDDKIIYEFNSEKYEILKEQRGIDLKDIVQQIVDGKVLDIVQHPNQLKYPNQHMYVIELNNYVYLVPFLKNGDVIFLKTAFPCRKAKKQYLA